MAAKLLHHFKFHSTIRKLRRDSRQGAPRGTICTNIAYHSQKGRCAMDTDRRPRRGSLGFGIVLVVLGLLLLATNLMPGFDPWPMIWRYWPVLLILLGLGKLFDHMRARNDPQARSSGWVSGTAIGLLILILLFGVSLSKSGASNPILHENQSVDAQGAQTVAANINMPAGQLTMNSGSSHLLDADYRYDQSTGK